MTMSLQPHAPADPERAYRLAHVAGFGAYADAFAAYAAGLAPFDVDTDAPIRWTLQDVRRLLFARWRAQHGHFDGDRFGLSPEPMPPIVRVPFSVVKVV